MPKSVTISNPTRQRLDFAAIRITAISAAISTIISKDLVRGRHGGCGGVEKKRGEENLTKDAPPKNGFWTPPLRLVRFPPPSGIVALLFLYRDPRRVPKMFLEGALSGAFSSPHTFCPPPPPMSWPNLEAIWPIWLRLCDFKSRYLLRFQP